MSLSVEVTAKDTGPGARQLVASPISATYYGATVGVLRLSVP